MLFKQTSIRSKFIFPAISIKIGWVFFSTSDCAAKWTAKWYKRICAPRYCTASSSWHLWLPNWTHQLELCCRPLNIADMIDFAIGWKYIFQHYVACEDALKAKEEVFCLLKLFWFITSHHWILWMWFNSFVYNFDDKRSNTQGFFFYLRVEDRYEKIALFIQRISSSGRKRARVIFY